MNFVRVSLVAGLVGVSVALAHGQTAAAPPTSPDEIIVFRKAGYKHIGEEFGAMKKAIDAGADVKPFAAGAKEIADWGRKIPTLFPPGTETGHDTHAQPAVWSERDLFDKNAAAMVTQAEKLAQVADTGDKAAFADQWKATGNACGACHANQKFRTRI